MKGRKVIAKSTSLVWRISTLVPCGEWVDKRVQAAPGPGRPVSGEPHASWMSSTLDLMNGADVSEHAGCEFDELFGQPVDLVALSASK